MGNRKIPIRNVVQIMYDWEIESTLSYNHHDIPSNIYLHICSTSPQISRIRYLPYENKFEIWTDCNYWKFSVYPEEKKGK